MLYRRKIIIQVLNAFDMRLDKINLMKLLLILGIEEGVECYDFVPYKMGCFSFTAYADLRAMHREKLIQETENSITLNKFDKTLYKIKDKDKEAIDRLSCRFRNISKEKLISYTYNKFPYYASKSTLKNFISPQLKEKIQTIIPSNKGIVLYTIGYEGKSLEKYFNCLIQNGIKTLIDVRKNPISMKYGFSGSTLKNCAESLGIKYKHMPSLGIASSKRKDISTFDDYQKLFAEYEATIIKNNSKYLKDILNILVQDKAIAITCFEADFNYCHRSRVAKHITKLPEWQYEVEHL